MRTFYIFNIDSNVSKLYLNNEFVLYDILYEIYKLDKKEVELAFKFFKQFVSRVNKNDLNLFLYNNFKDNMNYIKTLDRHVINDIFSKEKTELLIYNSHLKLHSNKELPKFLFLLSKYQNNFFVCDFENRDYFWINGIIKTVG